MKEWADLTVPEPNTGCLFWLGATTRAGYGLHRCDTPSCVNPDHLFLATQLENIRDMYRKGRNRKKGHARRRVAP